LKLQSAEGGFYTSQDADVDAALPGKSFYALSVDARAKLGREPRIDTNIYARENGWAISGLVAFYNATGDRAALTAAERAASYILANRAIEGGGFAHGARDRAGPYLGDTLAMGQAALDLYAATGDRKWLEVADRAGTFIEARFKDEAGGFVTTATPAAATGVFLKETKLLDEQVAATRFANALNRYLGKAEYRALAEHGARYLAAPAILGQPRPFRESSSPTASCRRIRPISPSSAAKMRRKRPRSMPPAGLTRRSTSASIGGTRAKGRFPTPMFSIPSSSRRPPLPAPTASARNPCSIRPSSAAP
jgi:uncharacterized protein YyaL (SSP411 family)